MPCYDPPPTDEELRWYAAEERRRQIKAGRWDLAATRKEVEGWLCDTLRGTPPTPELLRWWEAHKKYADAPRQPADEP
jgi:hypothetical protein